VILRNWFKLFFSTLLIGAVAALGAGLVLALSDAEFRAYGPMEIGYNMLMMAMAGLMFSILSQMGFFAYLMVNYIARDVFRKPTTWKIVQLFFILTVPFEIWLFLWKDTPLMFIAMTAGILAVSLLTAYRKVKLTNSSAWIPTVFFMFVATMLEIAIAIQVGIAGAVLFMAVPLLACNARQILMLHRMTVPKGETAVKAE